MSDENRTQGMMMKSEAEVDCSGLPEEMHEVVRKHGRALYVLVFNSNMAREALGLVMQQAQKHSSRGLANAAQVIGQVWADCSGSYAVKMGWGQKEIDACAADILAVIQTRVAMAERPGIILLN